MTGTEIAVLILFILFGLHLAFTVLLMLLLGGLIQSHEAHKKAVLGLAGAADKAIGFDRTRLAQIERFLVIAFKLDELFKPQPDEPKLSDQVAAPKKGEFKN